MAESLFLPLVADERDEAKANRSSCHFSCLFPSDYRSEITKPLQIAPMRKVAFAPGAHADRGGPPCVSAARPPVLGSLLHARDQVPQRIGEGDDLLGTQRQLRSRSRPVFTVVATIVRISRLDLLLVAIGRRLI